MFVLIKHLHQSYFAVECGRVLLFSISAGYVSANIRRLATRLGWDDHFVRLWHLIETVARWPRVRVPIKTGPKSVP